MLRIVVEMILCSGRDGVDSVYVRERERQGVCTQRIRKVSILSKGEDSTRLNKTQQDVSYKGLVYIPTKLGQVPFLVITELAWYDHVLV